MADDQSKKTRSLERLLDSPYVIGSPEAPADLSHIGNGRGELIDAEIDELIGEAEVFPVEASAEGAPEPERREG